MFPLDGATGAAAAAEAVRRTFEVHPSRRFGEELVVPVEEVLTPVDEGCAEEKFWVRSLGGLPSSSMRSRVRRSASFRSLAAIRRGVSPA